MTKSNKVVFGLVVSLMAFAIFFSVLARAVLSSPKDEVTNNSGGNDSKIFVPTQVASSSSTSSGNLPRSLPIRLIIPTLNINANVQRVGIAKSGSMAVPTNYTDVAWYRAGTIPGNIGSAVFDGHVDNGLGLAGVFKHLAEIKPGDDIYVTMADGSQVHFKVSSVDIYDYKNVPVQTIFNENDAARIRLITCDGTWVLGDRTYDHRLVVSGIISP